MRARKKARATGGSDTTALFAGDWTSRHGAYMAGLETTMRARDRSPDKRLAALQRAEQLTRTGLDGRRLMSKYR